MGLIFMHLKSGNAAVRIDAAHALLFGLSSTDYETRGMQRSACQQPDQASAHAPSRR